MSGVAALAGLPIAYREASDADCAWIVSAWTMSEHPWRGRKETAARKARRAMFRAMCEATLRGAERAVVACSANHATTNVGFLVARGGEAIYAYVSAPFRGQGIDCAMKEFAR